MRVRLLGPVDVVSDGVPRPVPGLRRKALLAALALRPGEVVAADHLIRVVWAGSAPAAATATLQSHLSHLRRALGDDAAIVARDAGYRLDLGAGDTDVQAAERLIGRGAPADLRAAVALGRGRPLAELAGLPWFDEQADRLQGLLDRAGSDLRAATAPAQLPLAPAGFAGRAHELAALERLLPGAGTVVISAVSGTAGIGKTSLALHWAHRNAARFPDGQLYVNLRGFDPGGTATDPAEAVRGFLDAFGVPAERIPAGADAQATLYRETLAGRRVLLVLDNARDADQVRPLLPGTPGSVVVATSRDRLAALGVRPLTLGLLSPDESRELLTHRLGADRVAAEPAAVDRIVASCARLPLALAIVAARAAIRPEVPLADLAGELDRAALDALRSGDPATDVRVVFSWSLRAVSPGAARMFRLLSSHPGLEIGTLAAASLAAEPPARAGRLLAELTGAHLLTETTPGRYGCHDLLRAYSAELPGEDDALPRLLDHYLHTAYAAALKVYPRWDRLALDVAPPGVLVDPPDDYDAALNWFATEHSGLVPLVERAADAGLDAYAWKLAWVFTPFFLRRGFSDELATMQHVALAAAGRLGDRIGQGHARRGLAMSDERSGRFAESQRHFQTALDHYDAVGEHAGLAQAHLGITLVAEQLGDQAAALRHAGLALDESRLAGDRLTEAHALNAIGWCHGRTGDHHQGLDYCRRSLAMLQDLGDRDGAALTWDSLGYIHFQLLEYAESVSCYQRSIDLFEELGDRYYMADSLSYLGDVHLAAGSPAEARAAWQRSLDTLDDLDHPDAAAVRAKMSGR